MLVSGEAQEEKLGKVDSFRAEQVKRTRGETS